MSTRQPYQGINTLLLAVDAMDKHYTPPKGTHTLRAPAARALCTAVAEFPYIRPSSACPQACAQRRWTAALDGGERWGKTVGAVR